MTTTTIDDGNSGRYVVCFEWCAFGVLLGCFEGAFGVLWGCFGGALGCFGLLLLSSFFSGLGVIDIGKFIEPNLSFN